MRDTGYGGDTRGCPFPTLSPNGAPLVLGGSFSTDPFPPPSRQEERACLTHFSLLPQSKGGREIGSLFSACAPGIGLAQERGHSSVDICSGSEATRSLGTQDGVLRPLSLVPPGS